MARRAKIPRFHEYSSFANSFDYKNQELNIAGYLGNNNLYNLELGCGTGQFSIELAKRHTQENYVAIDIKSDRMWHGAKKALLENVSNIAFLRTDIKHIDQIFSPNPIKQIWLTFPDPYPKKGDEKRRLTHHSFLKIYEQILISGGSIKLKTDNLKLYNYSLEQFKLCPVFKINAKSKNLHQDFSPEKDKTIQTLYESRFLTNKLKIYYVSFIKD